MPEGIGQSEGRRKREKEPVQEAADGMPALSRYYGCVMRERRLAGTGQVMSGRTDDFKDFGMREWGDLIFLESEVVCGAQPHRCG